LAKRLEILSQEPNRQLIKKAEKVIVKKDAVILAEAKMAKADYLITLDKKHFLIPEAVSFLKPKKIFTPKMFFDIFKTKR
jgi:predicted nucleic acid-binding protein